MASSANRSSGNALASTVYEPGSARTVALRDFAPDLPVTTPGILTDMDGAFPTVKGFKPRASSVSYAPALPSIPLGAFIANYSDGTQSIIAGTATGFFSLKNNAWTRIGSFSPVTAAWRFGQFNDDVIAVNAAMTPQVATGNGGTFAALTDTPPVGAISVVTALGQVFMFQGASWFSSAVGMDNSWVANLETLAGSGKLYEVIGNITGAVPFFLSIIAFKQNGIWSGVPIGPPDIMNWSLISTYTGCRNQEAIIELSDRLLFLGTDDFYSTQGYMPARIPNNLKEWFFRVADPNYLNKVIGWFDPAYSVAYWHFVSTTAPYAGIPDTYVCYNTRPPNRWGKGMLNVSAIPGSFPQNNKLTGTAALYFDQNGVLQQLSGAPGGMRLRSWNIGQEAIITQLLKARASYNLYPAVERMAVYSSYVLGGAERATNAIIGTDAWHNFRASDRYHRLELTTSGDCEVMALAAEGRAAGVR